MGDKIGPPARWIEYDEICLMFASLYEQISLLDSSAP